MGDYVWLVFIIFLIVFLLIRTRLMSSEPSDTASGAIAMALGIFLNGAAYQFQSFDGLGPYLTVCLFLIWLFIAGSFIKLAWQKQFKTRLFSNPIQSFAMGTWVAGTSVCGTVIAKRLIEWQWLAYGMSAIAAAIWLVYLAVCAVSLHKIVKSNLTDKVHGVILLATVSTQSLVVVFTTLYGSHIPAWFYAGMIVLGTAFYLLGFILIARRYIRAKHWNLADDWPNTNCIVHGAMSITGLACAVSGAVSANVTLMVWLWVLAWFVIIETVECVRAVLRIRKYGLLRGIWVYHVSQWSRNFTFGMLYAFTMSFDIAKVTWLNVQPLQQMQNAILHYGVWVAAALILNECLLFMRDKLRVGSSARMIQSQSAKQQ